LFCELLYFVFVVPTYRTLDERTAILNYAFPVMLVSKFNYDVEK